MAKERMRITRVYTRSGDKGKTKLVGGMDVAKDSIRIEAYGTVDELNAIVGLARAFWDVSAGGEHARVDEILARVQNDLFNVGSELATPVADRWKGMYRVGDSDVKQLESWCDEFNEQLGPLEEFILPGGGRVGAFLHQARTVCRRAERRVVTLEHGEAADVEGCVVYLNRLSDFLFVMGRWVAKLSGEPEVFWRRPEPEA